MKFEHLMLDIETMGSQSYSAITSIGAVDFNIETGDIGHQIEIHIDLNSCLDNGLKLNADTIMWWMGQSDDSRKNLIEGGKKVPLKEALYTFSLFMSRDQYIWGNSARFDCGILQNAFDKMGIDLPWDFRKERCLRTLVSMAPKVKENFPPNEGVLHNPIDDCIYQIGYAHATWKTING